jgi:hypothetical protein
MQITVPNATPHILMSCNKVLIVTKYGQTYLWVVPVGTSHLNFPKFIEV